MAGYDGTAPAERDSYQLNPDALSPYLAVFQEDAAHRVISSMHAISDILAGRQPGTTVVEITKPGDFERVAAMAIVPAEISNAQESVRKQLADQTYKELRQILTPQLSDEITDSGHPVYVEPETRFGDMAQRMWRDVFVPRGDGAGPTDYVDANPAQRVLREVDGYDVLKGEVVPETARPLSEADADELVGLMPAMLTYSTYKLAQWHGTSAALRSTAELLERLAVAYPDKITGIDLNDPVYRLALLRGAGEYDLRNRHATYDAREQAKRFKPSYDRALETFSRIQAQQYITVSQGQAS